MPRENDAPALDDAQLLLLDTLIYSFFRETSVEAGTTLAQAILDVDTGIKERMAAQGCTMGALLAEQMSYADWFSVVDAIRRDPVLCALTVDACSRDERGAKMACFSDAARRAYVIFAGTGAGEWDDNCIAGYMADTQQQLRALEWFEKAVAPKHYAHVVASGHSKGGNKAMYLAVQAGDALDEAVSFDGQGFSREFLAAYANDIARNAGKIRAYALDNDFVNGLLNPIAPPENRIYLAGERYDAPFAYHAPLALLYRPDPQSHRLTLRAPGPQGELGRGAPLLTEYLQTVPGESDLHRICNFLGPALEVLTSSSLSDAERRARMVKLSKSEDMGLTIDYLSDFFQRQGKNVTARDIVTYLFSGKPARGLDKDDLTAKAEQTLPDKLQGLLGNVPQDPTPIADRLRDFLTKGKEAYDQARAGLEQAAAEAAKTMQDAQGEKADARKAGAGRGTAGGRPAPLPAGTLAHWDASASADGTRADAGRAPGSGTAPERAHLSE